MASQVTFLASAAFIMDPLCIFVITTQDFFSVLLIFFSCMNCLLFLCCCMKKFFMRIKNNFLVVLRIIFNTTAANIMDMLCIFVITKQYFFQRVCNYFNNKSFCFDYSNTFFIHAMNYFSVVLRIIFLMYIKNYFLIGPRIIFRSIANLFLGLKRFAGLAVKRTGSSLLLPWAIILKTLQVKECFQRECQGETLSGKETKEVFIFLTKSVRS